MKVKAIVAALIAICSLWAYSSLALAQVEAISGIDASGNQIINEKVILAVISSKIGEAPDQELIDSDVRAIYALGYFKNVTASLEADGRSGVKLVYQVKENPQVKEIIIEGNTAFSTSEIASKLTLKTGMVLDYKKVRDDISSIRDLYQNQGYTMARVIDVGMDAPRGQVDFIIREGVIEAVTLEGNDATLDEVIYREMNIKPGSVFNEKELAKDLRRVFNLGFFSEVTPVFEPGTTADRVVLILKMKETRTNTVNFGGGYGEREGWFGFTDLAVNNLMGTGQSLLLKGQAGQELTTYQFKYANPWFLPDKFGDRTSFTFRIWNTMGTDIYLTQQDEWHVGWDAAIGKKLREEWVASYSLGSENVVPRRGASFEAYISDWVGVSLSYDTRDFWMNPTDGMYHTFSLKQGWKYANIASGYTKLGLDLNYFKPLAPSQILATHWGAGIGFGDVPLGELYWAGGPNTVRGYGINDIRKGARKLLFNLEYRYNFNESLQGVLFFDWGNAWDKGAPVPSDFLTGYGPGVRLTTPMGPIRLDYGIPGTGISGGILHFTIGQAF